MIKDLISDLAYNRINLSQALSRSKLLAYKINNDNFKEWLRKELEGYDYSDKLLPAYRRINCQMFITHSLPNGQKHSKPLVAAEGAHPDFYEEVNYFQILEPISVVEQQISELKDIGYIQLTAAEAYNISEGDRYQKWVIGGHRKVGKAQFQNVIELTKQKLLDTLLELDNQFPNLTSDFEGTKANMEKVQNIITNNIYGNNNPLNIAAGQNVEQKDIQTIFTIDDISKLESLGVDKKDIDDLKEIVTTSGKDKATLKDRSAKWLGSVLASVAGRGLYENIPAITEFIHRLI